MGVGDVTVSIGVRVCLSVQIYRSGGQMVIQLCDTVVEYDTRFKLYLTTKLSKPRFSPELFSKVCARVFAFTAPADSRVIP